MIEVGQVSYKCGCLRSRTDGMSPCGKGLGFPRPDGFYCDCGHDVECCAKMGLA